MVSWSPPPSPDGAASAQGAPGVAGVARRVPIPPHALAALPRPFTARRHLNRLRRALRREGRRTERRYGGALPTLRVYCPGTSCLAESVTVVGIDGEWWYRTSLGKPLAPCSRVDLAVSEVSTLLMHGQR